MLITLEGIDGSGKSTLYEGLKTRLADLHPLFTREPGSPYLGDAVRRAIAADGDPMVEAALFVADHAVHLAEVVRPALADGRIVISDRYSDSRFAYQEVSLAGVHPDPHGWLEAVHAGWSVRPDMTILLGLPVAVAMSRLAGRCEQEHFERQEFLEAVQKNYLARAAEDPARFVLVDADRDAETILDFVEKSIRAAVR
ncbi:MAG TPA: dTMP kinase [Methanocorpusculum sp.]|nr:dTMP kinase [Methanocorpusculum sp.]HJK79283.1 dTMP kinase [Methanocorpusculum sp.]